MRLLIVDDHPVVVSGCRAIFASRDDVEIVGVADGERGVEEFFDRSADLALVDVNLPGMSGFEVIRRIVARDRSARLIAFSMNEDPAVARRAIELGARAYLTKTDKPDQFLEAIDAVEAGGAYLTPAMTRQIAFHKARSGLKAGPAFERDEEILRLLGAGKSMAEIAVTLGLSYKTIANNCTALKNRLGVRSAHDLVRIAIESRKA